MKNMNMRKRLGESGRTSMRRRPGKPRLMSGKSRPPFDLDGKVDHLVCYLSGGQLDPQRTGVITDSPIHQFWVVDRDYELCRRINESTGFGVHSRPYDITSTWNKDEDRNVPAKWIQRIYKFAKDERYRCLHLVGYSGGGAVASSQLVDYGKDMVQSLVLINGPVAENKPHMNAAYYADRIKPRTLLIYGTKDDYRRAIDIWRKKNRAEPFDYEGEHDFGQRGKPSFESVARKVIGWLKQSPDQRARSLRLRRRRRRGTKARTKGH